MPSRGNPSLDIYGNPTVYSKETIGERFVSETIKETSGNSYPAVDPKMAEKMSPVMLEVLQALDKHTGTVLVAGNHIWLWQKKVLYVPTSSVRALERRYLVETWEEPTAFASEEHVKLTEAGRKWLMNAEGSPPKKISRAQKKRAIDDLVDVLRSGRES